jgi:hypothetical protein
VTLKRVITNQPENSIRESAAHRYPLARRRSETAALSAMKTAIGVVRLLPMGQEDWSGRRASRIASGPRRFL